MGSSVWTLIQVCMLLGRGMHEPWLPALSSATHRRARPRPTDCASMLLKGHIACLKAAWACASCRVSSHVHRACSCSTPRHAQAWSRSSMRSPPESSWRAWRMPRATPRPRRRTRPAWASTFSTVTCWSACWTPLLSPARTWRCTSARTSSPRPCARTSGLCPTILESTSGCCPLRPRSWHHARTVHATGQTASGSRLA